jgi:hypothetical protein
MRTIQAKVNSRLLTKASRLFTGTLEGRTTEILQNARRAGATEVEIANQDGYVTVRDNGQGIDDFSKVLDLGGSGWEEAFEQSEDPAGVGLFCLAPRQVTIRSNGQMVTIAGDGWTGAAVTVSPDPDPVRGTLLCFEDEPWSDLRVEVNAVFCGMRVIVDGKACPQEVFVSALASHHQALGCRIEVREEDAVRDMDHVHALHRADGGDDRVEVLLVVGEDVDVADLRRPLDANEIDRAEQAAGLADRGGQAGEGAGVVLDADADRGAEGG